MISTVRNPYLIRKAFKSYLLATVLASMALSMGVVIDGVIVGNFLGAKALSAINLASPMLQMFNAIYLLINVGGAMLVAMAIGKRNIDEANIFFSLSIKLNAIIGLSITVLGLCFSEEITHLFCSDEALFPLVHDYLKVVLWSAPIYLFLPSLCVYARTSNAPKLASIALIVANVVNLLLDIILIKGFGMGIMGSSIATSIGFFVGILIVLRFFIKGESVLKFVKSSWQWKTCTSVLLITGLPIALSSFLIMVRLISVNHIILDQLGAGGIAILSVCMNILMIASMFIGGTVQTMQPVAGVLYGAEDYKGINIVIRLALTTLMLFLLPLTILMWIMPDVFAGLFGLSGSELLENFPIALRLFALSIPAFGANYILMVIYQLNKRNKLSIMVSCLQALLVIPTLLIFTFFDFNTVLWSSFVVGEILVLIIIYIVSNQQRKKDKSLNFITLTRKADDESILLDFSVENKSKNIEVVMANILDFLKDKKLTDTVKNSVCLCCEELTNNILQHSNLNNKNTHFLDISARITNEKIILCLKDDGMAFNPIEYEPTNKLGLLLVKGICSELHYARIMGQNVVTVICTR